MVCRESKEEERGKGKDTEWLRGLTYAPYTYIHV
jgi:hypothetical protein